MKGLLWIGLLVACGQQAGPVQPTPTETRSATIAELRARMRVDPIAVLRELGLSEADFEPLAKRLYFTSPEAARRAASQKSRTPASFVDENGVTVLFNDHKWFCFQVDGTGVNMCAVTPAECVEFAEAMQSTPTCGVREAATCFTYKRDDIESGKCFSTPSECQKMYSVFLDEQTKITGPCMTLRYRGY